MVSSQLYTSYCHMYTYFLASGSTITIHLLKWNSECCLCYSDLQNAVENGELQKYLNKV